METRHRILEGDARDLSALAQESVHLVVTSPPYPMIAMWDDAVLGSSTRRSATSIAVDDAIAALEAFEAMHRTLDDAWSECARVLAPGGMLCIDVGDATRTVGGRFRCYPNRARITATVMRLGFDPLPAIVWRKPTNAPNKFMGSGMLPPGRLRHVRARAHPPVPQGSAARCSGPPRSASGDRRSAYFWEERNVWFSDLWTLGSVSQTLDDGGRSAERRFSVRARVPSRRDVLALRRRRVSIRSSARGRPAARRSRSGVRRSASTAPLRWRRWRDCRSKRRTRASPASRADSPTTRRSSGVGRSSTGTRGSRSP